MYKIKLAAIAKKEFKILKVLNPHIDQELIDELSESPHTGKPLKQDLTGKFSLRIKTYRILYTINEKDKIVTIVRIGHRSIVYLPKKK